MKDSMKISSTDKFYTFFIYIFSFLVLLIVLYPLIYVLSASISSPTSIVRGEIYLFPKEITFDAYKNILKDQEILRAYGNTIFYAVAGTTINIVMTVMAAYPLSKKDMRGRKFLTVLFTITMFFSGGMIPTFLIIRDLNLYNTYWAMLLPKSISVFNMFILRNYFQNSIPEEIVESAYVDGCSNTKTLTRIILPLSKSIIAVLVIFYVVGHWNSYFDAFLYLEDRAKFPLQVVLREILILGMPTETGSELVNTIDQLLNFESLKYAVIVVSSLPVLILYPLMQKYFVQGIMLGSVKG